MPASSMKPTVLILGGDMTGKAIIPIIAQGNDKFKVTLLDQESILDGKAEVDRMAATIQNRGYYPLRDQPGRGGRDLRHARPVGRDLPRQGPLDRRPLDGSTPTPGSRAPA